MRAGTRNLSLFVMVAAVVAFSTCQALAGSAIPAGTNLFQINPTASGTKVVGPLAIYYQIVAPQGICSNSTKPQVRMFFVMRLKQGSNDFAFAGSKDPVCYLDITTQRATFEDFFAETVIPEIFGADLPFELKSVTNLLQDGQPQFAIDAFWAIMDIEVAVQNK